MADRNWATDLKTIEHKLIQLDGMLVTTGAAGAVDTTNTLFTGGTITRTGVGTYQVALQDAYVGSPATQGGVAATYAMRSFGFTLGSDGTLSNIQNVILKALPNTIDLSVLSTSLIPFNTITGAPAVADANRAISVAMTFILKNGQVL